MLCPQAADSRQEGQRASEQSRWGQNGQHQQQQQHISTQQHHQHRNHHHHHHQHHHHQHNGTRHRAAHPLAPARAVDVRIPAIEKYAYCLCLHVKPTTIFIGVFKLIRALLFASILLNAEFSLNQSAGSEALERQLAPHLVMAESAGPSHGPLLGSGDEQRHRPTAVAVSILGRVVTACVSAVAVYAVVSGRAALLMPLYAMMLVDFFFTLPAFYNRELDAASLADNWTSKELLVGRSPTPTLAYSTPSHYSSPPAVGLSTSSGPGEQYARYTLIFLSTLVMISEIYFLCVVWKCYRYLRLIELIRPIRLSEFYSQAVAASRHQGGPGASLGSLPPNAFAQTVVRILGTTEEQQLDISSALAPPPYDSVASGSSKPPNYEEAIKSPASQLIFSIGTLSADSQQQQQQQQQQLATDHQATLDFPSTPPPQYTFSAPPDTASSSRHQAPSRFADQLVSTEANNEPGENDEHKSIITWPMTNVRPTHDQDQTPKTDLSP